MNLFKPAGMTSHDAVSAVRRIFHIKKVGHTGTLDPMAVGVLPICVGSATRAAEYLENDDKRYRCELLLGVETDTCDIWGKPLYKKSIKDVIESDIVKALKSQCGELLQYPPVYSAVRVDGKHLYEYARSGQEVDIKPRKVTVEAIEPVAIFHEAGRVLFDVHCSKGTYVRSLCRDIGAAVGCGGTMSSLIRTRSGRFSIYDSVTFEDIEGDIIDKREWLLPVDKMLSDYGRLKLSKAECAKYVNGGKIAFRNAEVLDINRKSKEERFFDLYLVYDENERFIGTAVADYEKRIYKVGKVFVR